MSHPEDTHRFLDDRPVETTDQDVAVISTASFPNQGAGLICREKT